MVIKIHISHTLLVFGILFCTEVSSQYRTNTEPIIKNRLHFTLLDVGSGLSHNVINDVAQDSLGFIWVATVDGLNRYDGNNFEKFRKQVDENQKGLANNHVQKLQIESDSLLIATDAGLNSYNQRTANFLLLDSDDGLYNNSVSALKKISGGRYAIGTYRGGIQILDSIGNLKNLEAMVESPVEFSSTEISAIEVQGDSILWIGTFNDGLNKVNLKKGSLQKIYQRAGDHNQLSTINTLYTDASNNLWIGTSGGLKVITSAGDTLGLKKYREKHIGLTDDDILCFEEDKNGNMWVGTRNGGLNIIGKESFLQKNRTVKIEHFLPNNDGSSVYNRTIMNIFNDMDGNMWLGTPTGLNFVDSKGEKVQLLQSNPSNSNSISHTRIGSVANASKNRFWIGTDGGGLDLLDLNKGKIAHFENVAANPASLSNNYIINVYQQSETKVWVGTYRGGLNLLNPITGESQHFLTGSQEDGNDVREIYESKNGHIWVGTNRGGLFLYEDKKNSFRYIESLGKIDIRDIQEDSNGILWLATYGSGIIAYNPITDRFENYNKTNLPELNGDVFFAVLTLETGEILAGSRYNGLLRFNPKTKNVRYITEENGLSNNTVNSLILVDSIEVWMGTYKGLNRYNISSDDILDISSYNNIQEGEFNLDAAMNDEGYLLFGGTNGVNYFNPKDFSSSVTNYPIRFKGLKVLNKDIPVVQDSKKEILQETLFFQNELTLKYNQNTFSINYVALKYPEAKTLTYSYKLEGYNEFWIESESGGTANFTSVPPGDYEFFVRADANNSDENRASLKITIVPPFWKTLPAYFLYVLAITLGVWFVAKYYSERLKLKTSLLFEQKQRSLENDLNEERFRFFTAFSHELKTPLTLILAPVEKLLGNENKKEIRKDLLYIHRNAKTLFKSIDDLLKFRKAEEGLSRLNLALHDLPSRLRRWVKSYGPYAKEKEIKLEYTGPIESKIFEVDIDKIEVIVNNLLSNAIKYCSKGDNIKVVFDSNEKGFEIIVSDTGMGIEENELPHIFEWYYRSHGSTQKSGTGVGLALTRSFTELHAGSIDVSSQFGTGTSFHLKFPIKEVEFPEGIIFQDSIDETTQEFEYSKQDIQNAKLKSHPDRRLIMIIDDNEEILGFLAGIFKTDFDIVSATNGLEGIEKAKKYIPDLIISDVMMPEKSGFDLCAELKRNFATSHIPIILLTADTSLESKKEGYDEGADDYVTKPFNTKLLQARVNNLLDSRELLRKSFRMGIDEENELDTNDKNNLLAKEKEFLKKLDNIIEKEISSNTDNVERIAQEMGMSRASLYRKLKAITDFSINEYIRNLKIERAADMIKYQKYSVSQAAYEVGFNDTKYFRKIFKDRYGENPSSFKE